MPQETKIMASDTKEMADITKKAETGSCHIVLKGLSAW